MEKAMWWISLICLGLFVNLIVGGMLTWSDNRKDEREELKDRAGYLALYWTLFLVSCILIGLGTVKAASMMGL